MTRVTARRDAERSIDSLRAGDVALIGICSDSNSSYLRGAAQAPARIRAALLSGASNLSAENGVSLASHPGFVDLGDRDIGDDADSFMGIEHTVAGIVARDARPLTLGGDHAITWPVVRALTARHGPLNILHFDAHPDLYDEFEGSRMSHACPFARIMEEGLAKRLVQVGIRTLNVHLREQAARFGVEVHEMREFDAARFNPGLCAPAYVTFDLDGLDPAFAPGVSHHEPGGLSTRDALDILARIDVPLVGADIVEYNPDRDLHDMTATVAAKILRELAGNMLRG